MATAIRPICHEDRLSLVEHLEELRTRLIISAVVLAVAFGFCLWQNHELLHILNKPLQTQTKKQVAKGQGTVGQAVLAQQSLLKLSGDTQAALHALEKPGSGVSAQARAAAPGADRSDEGGRGEDPAQPDRRQPGDAGRRRAVHDDDHRVAAVRAGDLAAADPVRGLRVHPAGAEPG